MTARRRRRVTSIWAVVVLIASLGSSILAAPPATAAPGDITTFAGGGLGDGGPGDQASLANPQGIAVDAAGNVYIADTAHHRVRKIDTTGVITTVAGTGGGGGFSGDNGPATQATLSTPADVAVDAAGNLYITDQGNARIRKVDTAGIITTVAGNGIFDDSGDGGPATSAGMIPFTLAVDAAGQNLYYSDQNSSRVRRIDLGDNTIHAFAGIPFDFSFPFFGGDGGPAVEAKIDQPYHLAVDGAGNVFIADFGNARVRKVDVAGIITTIAGNGDYASAPDGSVAADSPLDSPAGLALHNGELFVTEAFGNRVIRIDANGIVHTVAGTGAAGFSGDGGPATAAELNNPGDVGVDSAGNVYILDQVNNRVRKVDVNGIITTVAGGGVGDTNPATQALLTGPWGIAIDAGGNVFVSENGSLPQAFPQVTAARVRKISAGGIITTVVGGVEPGFSGDGGPATVAQLDDPRGLAVDGNGSLYIADCGNHRVRKVDPTGIMTTVAGGGSPAQGVGDGGQATNAALACPAGVFVVPAGPAAGTFYIADAGDHRVRKVDPSGIITTVAGTGVPGFSGDKGPAPAAQLNAPQDVAVDAAGNLYIADEVNNRVRKVDQHGIITTFAGDGTQGYGKDGVKAPNAAVTGPTGVGFDPAGNLFIAEGGLSRVRRVDGATRRITTVAGTGIPGFSGDGGPAYKAQLNRPTDVAFDAAGDLYITDRHNERVRKVEAGSPAPPPTSGCGAVITADLTLTADLGPCPGEGIIVAADNVTLDLNGHSVIGDGSRTGLHPGITILGRKGVTVTGGTVRGFDAGVSIIGGFGNTVSGMVVRDNFGGEDPSTSVYGDGIAVFFSSNNRILRNRVTRNGIFDGIGILGLKSNNNLIRGNLVEQSVAEGILVNPVLGEDLPRMLSISGNDIIANRVRDNGNSGIANISNRDAVISDNVVTGNGLHGIPGNGIGIQHLLFAEPETRDLVQNNRVHGNGGNGIDVPNGQGNRILDNDASNNALNSVNRFPPVYDLRDGNRDSAGNPSCDANIWSGNIWGSGGFFPECTATGGHPAPGSVARAAGAPGSEAVKDPPFRRHPPMP